MSSQSTIFASENLQFSHLSILFKHVVSDYLDSEDKSSILSVTKIEDFDIANLFNVDLRYNNDYALRLASELGRLSVVQFLVEKGADIHVYRERVFKSASENGHLSVVKYLLERGADIHTDSDYAIKFASLNGHLPVVKYLTEQGVDTSSINVAIGYACARGHRHIIQYLTEKEM